MSTYDEYHRNYYLTHKEQYLRHNQNRRKTLRHLWCGRSGLPKRTALESAQIASVSTTSIRLQRIVDTAEPI